MPKQAKEPPDWWAEERAARERGFRVIGGIDEAGRGPLAGPVVAACVVLPFGVEMAGVRDSKTLSEKQREAAFARIHACAEAVGVGIVDAQAIDALNILRATHEAMRQAYGAIASALRPDHVLVDGRPVQPFPALQTALVKGDARSVSIAAASIIAKVTRDRLMREYDATYPQYGFAAHKGYGCAEHLARLREHGPCPLHRRSFAPVAALLTDRPIADCAAAASLFPDFPVSQSPDFPFSHVTGLAGESIAAAHLRRLGWEVLATRYRCGGGELDVVAKNGETIVFVEVKARHGRTTSPAEAVDGRKRARMCAAAEAWLAEHDGDERACRFDVAEVMFGADGNASVRLIRNAFMAGE